MGNWEGTGGLHHEEAVKAERALHTMDKNVGDMISCKIWYSKNMSTNTGAAVNDPRVKKFSKAAGDVFTRQHIEVKRRIEEEMEEMQETLKHKSNNISTYIYDSMHTEEDKIESTKRAVDATKTLDETQVRTPVPCNDPRSTQVLG
ncbi:hypothetical protein BOVATA_006900 [Babesia ovata]|uniref:Uncharacterized protein n=1 Tax=Babesia ovata TaxID=189622 RepID=A0A2H6K873_9APIC|nr:uncharacterized protein BOVATA_006900 [Babesia ovata]GBE59197.1 hypothetical protein BOVATA_006900 [Babesia ovata]